MECQLWEGGLGREDTKQNRLWTRPEDQKKKKKNAAKDGESVRQERKERERETGGGGLVGGYQVLFIGG